MRFDGARDVPEGEEHVGGIAGDAGGRVVQADEPLAGEDDEAEAQLIEEPDEGGGVGFRPVHARSIRGPSAPALTTKRK